jgi:uncharacterized membrane protein YoaK (UPF0700 family)
MHRRVPLLLAVFLTWMAGFVDAVGYISLGHIYTANMSGNSVAIGIHAVSGEWAEALRRLWPVVAYFGGLLFCRLLITYGAQRRIRRIATPALLCEIGLLLPVCLTSLNGSTAALPVACVGLLAIAMGIQNAALTHFSTLTVHTGFVTGTLVKCAEYMAKYLAWVWDQIGKNRHSVSAVIRRSNREATFRMTVWLTVIWAAYVLGACCGALGDHLFRLRSLVVPIVCLAGVSALDLKHPLAVREEQEQANLPA